MQRANHPGYSFDEFTVDLAAGCLLHNGREVKLRPKSFEALRYLLENAGRLVSKDELMRALWPDSFVTENSLVKCMKDVRLALEDESQRYIKTVPKRGYIFVFEVSEKDVLEKDVFEKGAATLAPTYTEQLEGVRIVITEEQEPPTGTESFEERPRKLLPNSTRDSRRQRWLGNKIAQALSLVVIALILALSYYFIRGRSKQTVSAAPRSIAVLPFKPLVADSRDESFEMGMADTLITKLSSLREMTVRPISAVRGYGRLDQDPVQAGREQGVDAVLDGSILKSDGKIRVTVRFLNVHDGSQIWAYKCEEQCSDIFSMQDSISEKVAGTLALKLTADEQKRLIKRYTENQDAYQLYLKGRYFWEMRTEESMKKAVDYFDQAIQIDPQYALAYAGIGHAYTAMRAHAYVGPVEGAEKMKDSVARALDLDDNLAEAHTVMGTYKITQFDWPGAEQEFKRAIELNPNYPTAHLWYGFLLEGLGRQDENVAQRERALELDPLNFEINASLGFAFFQAGQYDKAIEQENKALELNPNFQATHQYLGQMYLAKRMYDKAISEFQNAWDKGYLGYAYGVSGRRAEAQKVLATLLEAPKQRYVSPLSIAMIYIGLNDRDRALTWLEKAYNDHATYLLVLKVDPVYSDLRSDPKFQDLLRRTHLQ